MCLDDGDAHRGQLPMSGDIRMGTGGSRLPGQLVAVHKHLSVRISARSPGRLSHSRVRTPSEPSVLVRNGRADVASFPMMPVIRNRMSSGVRRSPRHSMLAIDLAAKRNAAYRRCAASGRLTLRAVSITSTTRSSSWVLGRPGRSSSCRPQVLARGSDGVTCRR